MKKKLSPPLQSHELGFEEINNRTAEYWENRRKMQPLEIFHMAAKEVPAYKNFIRSKKIIPSKIRTPNDFLKIPETSKKNYITQHPLQNLMKGGTLYHPLTYTSTSGSTGEPTYFARSEKIDWQGSVIHEMFIHNGNTRKESTLIIVCFGMGIWIGGLITFEGLRMLSRRGIPLSIITPGINKSEIFRALKKLSPEYGQTILYGYPPFIKDIVDEAPSHDVDLKKISLRISTAAEAFTEDFRSYIGKQVGMIDPARDIMNIYGTADIGAVAFETPFSVEIRKLAVKNPSLFTAIFKGANKTPTLAQFIPDFVNFEEQNGELFLTGDNTMPLVRYAIGDHGGVIGFEEMLKILKENNIAIPKKKKGVLYPELPFVFVFERNDLSTTLYGAQIYPEAIREVLIKSPFNKSLTGKFTLITRLDKKHDQYLEINLEMRSKKKIKQTFKLHLLDRLIRTMILRHSEYKELVAFIGKRAYPKLVFWPYEDPLYFKPGIKQSWIKK